MMGSLQRHRAPPAFPSCRSTNTSGSWTRAVSQHRLGCASRSGTVGGAAAAKEVWLQTSNKAAFTAALEGGGVSSFVFGPDPEQRALAESWSALARFRALLLDDRGELVEAGSGRAVGEVVHVDGPEATRALEARVQRQQQQQHEQQRQGGAAAGDRSAGEWVLVLDARDWKVIPAENLVALVQPPGSGVGGSTRPAAAPLRLLAAAGSAGEARLMLEALEAGTAGVLLRSDSPAEVRAVVSYVARRASEESSRPDQRLRYEAATVRAVRPLGMGDRACVDLAGLLKPGEGLLVGSFARCLALVHSECAESDYIASRPFRVNAGPVHAYVSAPGGRTRYLCELVSGSEVLVADQEGRTRTALVGRVKIERRPLVLVEFETPSDGSRHSLMLQNAETVKLVGPVRLQPQPQLQPQLQPQPDGTGAPPERATPTGSAASPVASSSCVEGRGGAPAVLVGGDDAASCVTPRLQGQQPQGRVRVPDGVPSGRSGRERGGGVDGAAGEGGVVVGSGEQGWRAISVSALRPGDQVYVLMQAAARHTGIAIEEFIVEK